MSGYPNGNYGPNDKVTREQLAVMLDAYAKKVKRMDVWGSLSELVSMSGYNKVSDWAVPYEAWCFKKGILSGAAGQLRPQGNASRVEACKMVVCLHDLLT